MPRQRFVVIVEGWGTHRAFGPYQTFRRAEGDAKAWDGFVLLIESPEIAVQSLRAPETGERS
jgi:hypothetical protein